MSTQILDHHFIVKAQLLIFVIQFKILNLLKLISFGRVFYLLIGLRLLRQLYVSWQVFLVV